MLDLSPIANAIKSVQAPPPAAMPQAAEEMKPVPQAEIEHAVPPLPAKGGEPGLGEHLDLYDTQAGRKQIPPASREASVAKDAAAQTGSSDTPQDPTAAPAAEIPDPVKEEVAKLEKAKTKLELLGNKTGLPQPTTDPPPAELPFLTPLGGKVLGQAIDARI